MASSDDKRIEIVPKAGSLLSRMDQVAIAVILTGLSGRRRLVRVDPWLPPRGADRHRSVRRDGRSIFWSMSIRPTGPNSACCPTSVRSWPAELSNPGSTLIASGVDSSAALESYAERFAATQRQSAGLCRSDAADAVHRARVLLDWLHRHVLTGEYQPACTELHRTLDTGHFSCVTSTILFRCLAESQGLTTETISQPGHVFCRWPGSPAFLIQTTSPTGIVESGPPDSLPNTADDTAVSQASSRVLTDVQLVAKIYYNRGVLLLKSDAYRDSLPWLLRASQLDADDVFARGNLLACLNNWAISECHAGRFEQAVKLLERGKSIAPGYAIFTDNEIYVQYRWARIAEIWLNSSAEMKPEETR
jgi:tetratricopeptide (TPR) repeat protein